ncbi:MAG: DUF4062 domain-containing protein [Methylococcaceae bacterium]
MDKRYQVFVSSTYADLEQEREHVIRTLMEMDCIPAGMELFPTADEEQWEFIKKVIDDCDYYLLIIGGRYGSTTADGISYTESEFDYAVKKGLKVIGLIHGEPNNIPFGKSESNPELRDKLLQFRGKVMTGRLIKFWKTAEDLPGLVSLNLTKTIKMYPAIGWVRGNQITNEELLIELNQLRKENQKLLQENPQFSTQQIANIEEIADINSMFTVHGIYYGTHSMKYSWVSEISWNEIFSLISPYLATEPLDVIVKQTFARSLMNLEKLEGRSEEINDQDFKTITIQLKAYGLINTNLNNIDKKLRWCITNKGEQLMFKNRIVKKTHLTTKVAEA